ncbi:MAG TPA: hypothetical protein VFH73_27675 [Polyangia bacterium]|nr:hypothetical protein [Polyangia bacterium]
MKARVLTAPRPAAARLLRFTRWIGGSIAYIYVYLRGKLDAGERRRRLCEERNGAERLLSGAAKELGATILREGIAESDLTGLLEAIGRAEARREAALADIAASERLQLGEDARLAAQEAALEAELRACETAHREVEGMLRAVTAENQAAVVRLERIKDDLERLMREALLDPNTASGSEDRRHGPRIRHETSALNDEQAALKEQAQRLDRQLVQLRERSASLRTATASARIKRDATVATRRQASSAMGASIASHSRERADAEREIGVLTEQLGRAAAQIRPPGAMLQPLFQRIDRLAEAVAERGSDIAALDQAAAHYDERKLLTGVGLVTSMIAVTVAVIWVVLRSPR